MTDPLITRLLAFFLSIQILLALLVPGILVHGRTLFICDIWVLVTLFALALGCLRLGRWPKRKWVITVGLVGLLLTMSFLHGRYRDPITSELLGLGVAVAESDRFNAFHEFVIVARFMTWIIEGAWVWWFVGKMSTRERGALAASMARSLFVIAGIAACLTVLSGLSASFTDWLAGFYGFRGDLPLWRGRAFGPFRTPLEAGLTLALVLLLLISRVADKWNGRRLGLGFLYAVGVILSRTFTSVGALAATWILSRLASLKLAHKTAVAFALAVLGTFFILNEGDLLRLKWGDLVYRFTPWRVMLETLFSHPGSFLLGHGFAPINVDNAYLFILFRVGVIGFAVLITLAFCWGRTNWKRWTLAQREILVFLLLTGLTLDTFILRPVVMVFIAAGLPLLYPYDTAKIGGETT